MYFKRNSKENATFFKNNENYGKIMTLKHNQDILNQKPNEIINPYAYFRNIVNNKTINNSYFAKKTPKNPGYREDSAEDGYLSEEIHVKNGNFFFKSHFLRKKLIFEYYNHYFNKIFMRIRKSP